MAMYRLTIPAWHRFEGGVRRDYRDGDLLELSDKEYKRLRFSVEGPVDLSRKAEAVAASGAEEAKDKIAKTKDPETVQEIRAAESGGKARKTVLEAADERLEELAVSDDLKGEKGI